MINVCNLSSFLRFCHWLEELSHLRWISHGIKIVFTLICSFKIMFLLLLQFTAHIVCWERHISSFVDATSAHVNAATWFQFTSARNATTTTWYFTTTSYGSTTRYLVHLQFIILWILCFATFMHVWGKVCWLVYWRSLLILSPLYWVSTL
jgi:hypothetical protein